MRLTLAEVAYSLGCGLDTILWDGSSPDADPPARSPREPALTGQGGRNLPTPAAIHDKELDLPWGQAAWAHVRPSGAQFDSRKVRPGDLFFCLPGNTTDGHDFASDAAGAGASAIIAERNPFWPVAVSGEGEKGAGASSAVPAALPPVFLVPDVRKALWRLAVCHRDTSMARVVGITGTAGKTSVKEVLAQVLAVRGRTERNVLNLNNQIGLPVSILNAAADASFWVLEVGISEAHDMDELGAILRPDMAVVLNVGEGHLSGLGEKGVACHKARLFDYIAPGGVAFVSDEYPELTAEAEKRLTEFTRRGVKLLRFSTKPGPVFCRAGYEGMASAFSGRYRVYGNSQEYVVEAPFRGAFGSENVAAIAAVAGRLGLTSEEIISGFAGAQLPAQRFACQKHGGFTLVDDSYNANPLSSTRMLSAARDMADEVDLPLILVMGEMLELGRRSEFAHLDLGRHMAAAAPEVIFWKGGQAKTVLGGLQSAGYSGAFYPVSGGQDFSLLLEEIDLKSGLVLFKGSRGNHLERLVDVFRDHTPHSGEFDAL